jgi:hypothetical protein
MTRIFGIVKCHLRDDTKISPQLKSFFSFLNVNVETKVSPQTVKNLRNFVSIIHGYS